MKIRTIAFSGFYPFGDYQANSTQLTLDLLRWKTVAGFKVERTLLFEANIPDWLRGGMLLYEAQKIGADRIISLGMSSEKKGFCIETVARNRIHNLKYCPEHCEKAVDPQRPLDEELHVDLSPWNISAFQKRMAEENIPVEFSTESGGFCCNHLMFQVLNLLRSETEKIPFLFIHVPCCEEAVVERDKFLSSGKIFLSEERIVRGLAMLLEGV